MCDETIFRQCIVVKEEMFGFVKYNINVLFQIQFDYIVFSHSHLTITESSIFFCSDNCDIRDESSRLKTRPSTCFVF